ncbi:hypothetical protein FA13DRAFT_198025 [Coprinellus micaceus]|uniref:Uncharacterized protein n=1 Tax=Coprinellus micaceus TaxID=71717 RepID=A0A4Y7TGJ7_COPMI|nr:hypothetical protein FA13DRAFT_198025 [Coprinellus micaceus]
MKKLSTTRTKLSHRMHTIREVSESEAARLTRRLRGRRARARPRGRVLLAVVVVPTTAATTPISSSRQSGDAVLAILEGAVFNGAFVSGHYGP